MKKVKLSGKLMVFGIFLLSAFACKKKSDNPTPTPTTTYPVDFHHTRDYVTIDTNYRAPVKVYLKGSMDWLRESSSHFVWKVGDSTLAVDSSYAEYTFNKAGQYPITFTVKYPEKTVSKTKTINIKPAITKMEFTKIVLNTCPELTSVPSDLYAVILNTKGDTIYNGKSAKRTLVKENLPITFNINALTNFTGSTQEGFEVKIVQITSSYTTEIAEFDLGQSQFNSNDENYPAYDTQNSININTSNATFYYNWYEQ